MRSLTFLFALLLFSLTLFFCAGCGSGGSSVNYHSVLGPAQLSFNLPPNWKTDGPTSGVTMISFLSSDNPEHYGTALFWEAEGKELQAWVDDYLAQSRGFEKLGEELFEALGQDVEGALTSSTVSMLAKTQNDLEVIELVEDTQGLRATRLFVKKGDEICEVSYFCPPADWETAAPAFRKSLESVKVK